MLLSGNLPAVRPGARPYQGSLCQDAEIRLLNCSSKTLPTGSAARDTIIGRADADRAGARPYPYHKLGGRVSTYWVH